MFGNLWVGNFFPNFSERPPGIPYSDWDAVSDRPRPCGLLYDASRDEHEQFPILSSSSSAALQHYTYIHTLDSERHWIPPVDLEIWRLAASLIWFIKRLRGYAGVHMQTSWNFTRHECYSPPRGYTVGDCCIVQQEVTKESALQPLVGKVDRAM